MKRIKQWWRVFWDILEGTGESLNRPLRPAGPDPLPLKIGSLVNARDCTTGETWPLCVAAVTWSSGRGNGVRIHVDLVSPNALVFDESAR